jgi:hypothetical protein
MSGSTREYELPLYAAQPAACSQQPASLLFSEATGISMLLGFVGAWLPGGCG